MLDRQRSTLRQLIAGCATLAFPFASLLVVAAGCSSSDVAPPAEGGACPSGGGPVAGMATDRCMGSFQEVGACMMEPPDDGGDGDQDGGAEPTPETNIGSSADDDDCKFHVSFTNDCVQQNGAGTTFRVTLTSLTQNMMTVPGAAPYIEASLTETHPAGGNIKSTVVSPGVYDIGPILFDAPGKWTVRFHFFAGCSDVPEDSPHSHAAFFINVP